MEILFWSSVGFILYTYLGYPLLLMILSVLTNRTVNKGGISPRVSFIITVFNEERQIRDKIENTLNQDYPHDKLEIIVTSDCSNDGTDDIVRGYESGGIRLVRASRKRGKEAAQKLAIDSAAGEILIFSDAATRLPADGISNIVKNFADLTVGCVSSVDRFIDCHGVMSGEGTYLKYEMLLRNLETKVNTLVGLSGSFFAARREVCQNWATDLQSDFHTLLNCVKMGLRGVADPKSIGCYNSIVDESKEFDRKVRTVVRGISVLMKNLGMLNPLRYGLFAWQLFSHKLCRWLVPFAMILALISNGLLIGNSTFYLSTFVLQSTFYVFGIGSIRSEFFRRNSVFRILAYLVLTNLCVLNAWYRYANGHRIVSWVPSER